MKMNKITIYSLQIPLCIIEDSWCFLGGFLGKLVLEGSSSWLVLAVFEGDT